MTLFVRTMGYNQYDMHDFETDRERLQLRAAVLEMLVDDFGIPISSSPMEDGVLW